MKNNIYKISNFVNNFCDSDFDDREFYGEDGRLQPDKVKFIIDNKDDVLEMMSMYDWLPEVKEEIESYVGETGLKVQLV
jgi:hypothetical protein